MANPPHTPPADTRVNPLSDFLVALQFLTVSPSFIKRTFTASELGRSTAYYPLVGGLIGGLLWLANRGLDLWFPDMLRAALVLGLWIIITGALHLDGFLDSCDGLLGGLTPKSRLEIMKDERVGAFGFSGGVILLLVKFSALAATAPTSPALILAPTLSRACMTLAIYAYPYARIQGLGKAIKDRTGLVQVSLAGLIALAVAWFAAGLYGIVLLLVAVLLTWIFTLFCLRRIPGLTGDTYGALNESIELAILLLAVALRFGVLP